MAKQKNANCVGNTWAANLCILRFLPLKEKVFLKDCELKACCFFLTSFFSGVQ